jgi:hypothetical protein
VFGGAPKSNPCTYGPPANLLPASRHSYRMRLSWEMGEDNEPIYSFATAWVQVRGAVKQRIRRSAGNSEVRWYVIGC